MPSVFILEDDPLIVEFLSDYFSEFSDYDLIGCCNTLEGALPLIREHQPDLLITDLQLTPERGHTNLAVLKEAVPYAKIGIYSGNCEPPVVQAYIESGVDVYILKSDGMAEVSNALAALQSGERYFSKSIREMLRRIGFELSAC